MDGPKGRQLSASRMTSVTSVQLKNDLKEESRPHSAGPNLSSISKTRYALSSITKKTCTKFEADFYSVQKMFDSKRLFFKTFS